MKIAFVETENWRRLSDLASHLRSLPEEEPRLGIVSGRTGLGKTWAVDRYYTLNKRKHGYIYLRALDLWSPSAMLKALAHKLDGYPWRERARCFDEVKTRLHDMGGQRGHIIIDEADYIAADRHLLNTIRDLHDSISGSIILVGEEGLQAKLSQVKHFWGRVATQPVKFAPLNAQDVAFIAHALCELSITEDGKAKTAPLVLPREEAIRIAADTKGEFRLVKKALRKVENDMRTNGLSVVSPKLITEALDSIKRAA